jgi:hypothetical protein
MGPREPRAVSCVDPQAVSSRRGPMIGTTLPFLTGRSRRRHTSLPLRAAKARRVPQASRRQPRVQGRHPRVVAARAPRRGRPPARGRSARRAAARGRTPASFLHVAIVMNPCMAITAGTPASARRPASVAWAVVRWAAAIVPAVARALARGQHHEPRPALQLADPERDLLALDHPASPASSCRISAGVPVPRLNMPWLTR